MKRSFPQYYYFENRSVRIAGKHGDMVDAQFFDTCNRILRMRFDGIGKPDASGIRSAETEMNYRSCGSFVWNSDACIAEQLCISGEDRRSLHLCRNAPACGLNNILDRSPG